MIAGGFSDNVLSDLTGGIGIYTGAMDKLELEYIQYFMKNCLCVSSKGIFMQHFKTRRHTCNGTVQSVPRLPMNTEDKVIKKQTSLSLADWIEYHMRTVCSNFCRKPNLLTEATSI